MRYAIGVVPVGVNLRALPLRGVLGVGVLADSALKITFFKVLNYHYWYLERNKILVLHYKLQL